MFATPMPDVVLVFFMLGSFLIAVPTGVKIFNWIATLWRGTIEITTPLLFAVGLHLRCSSIGGITGVFLAVFPVDWQLTDTYFVVAHLHYVLIGGAVFAIFAGIYYWFPKMTGRMLSEGLGQDVVLADVRRLQRHVPHPALDGPRRACRGASTSTADVGHLELYNLISTVGSFILALGILVTVDQRHAHRSSTARSPGPTRGRPTRSSGSRPRRRRSTTSTSSRASARSSR